MKVIYKCGDYDVFLEKGELEKIVVRNNRNSSLSSHRYPWFQADIIDDDGKLTGEWLAITCSNDSSVAHSPGGILFARQDDPKDINVYVFTPKMMKQEELVFYRRENRPDFTNIYLSGFLMTRYDGHSDKILIRSEIPEPELLGVI